MNVVVFVRDFMWSKNPILRRNKSILCLSAIALLAVRNVITNSCPVFYISVFTHSIYMQTKLLICTWLIILLGFLVYNQIWQAAVSYFTHNNYESHLGMLWHKWNFHLVGDILYYKYRSFDLGKSSLKKLSN